MLTRRRKTVHGLSHPDPRTLALNLSLVLHERSDSDSVRSAVRACLTHHRSIGRLDQVAAEPATASEVDGMAPEWWLTATVGLPHLLPDALSVPAERCIRVDDDGDLSRVEFFRAPALLSLPSDLSGNVGVAALVLRPGYRSSHLAIAGIYDWAIQRDAAIRAVERIIQAHAGQWLPPRALWDAPAERLLPAEVY